MSFALENPEAFRLISQRIPVDATTDELATAQQRIERKIARETSAIAADIDAAIEAGEITPMPVSQLMAFLWATWAGVIGMAFREDSFRITAEDVRAILAGAAATLTRGARPGEGRSR